MFKKTISLLLAGTLVLTAVGCSGGSAIVSGAKPAASSEEQSAVDLTDVTASFVFTENGVTAAGETDSYALDGTAVTIQEPGSYLFSGVCADGSIKVKKGTTGVTLLLNGLDLTSADTAPIVCAKSTEVTIFVVDGTENTLTDSEQNNDDLFSENENAENAVIKCKDGSQVVLCGSGSLSIAAKGKNGIKSGEALDDRDASLTIRELTMDIDAPVNDAVNAEQLLNVESGALTIFAGDDALHCDLVLNVGAEGTAGPTIDITDCEEGIEGAELNIFSGDISIRANDDCLNAANSDLTDYAFAMNISGGKITAYSVDGDGFDSNGDLTISGGYVEVWTANRADNQPLDADGTVNITGGTVLAAGGSSGMGLTLVTEQGCVRYGSSGFGGFNGAEEPGEMMEVPEKPEGERSEPPAQPEQPEQTERMEPQELPQQDGEMPPELPDGMPDASDSDENFAFFGKPGGMGGMGGAESILTEGTEFALTAEDGTVVFQGTAMCDMAYLFFCAPELVPESSYSLTADDTSIQTETAQSGEVSTMSHPGEMLFQSMQKFGDFLKQPE